MNPDTAELLAKTNRRNLWDEEPVFCFTTDIDWASEAVLGRFFLQIPLETLKLTAFVTHESGVISKLASEGRVARGIHPNFLPGSSHGNSFRAVIEECLRFAPEAKGARSHRLFDVTDITHLLANDFGFQYVSNLGTTMASRLRPVLHESRLIHYPIFFEDGSHLYNGLDLRIAPYEAWFREPGIKLISFHPMNMVFNTPHLKYMRNIKDSLSREAFNNIDEETIDRLKHTGAGIANTVDEIIDFALRNNNHILSLDGLYQLTITGNL